MASIVIPGLAANYPNPGVYEDIQFAVGPAAGSGNARKAILLGNFLPAGTATASTLYGPDTAVPCQTESDVIGLFGTGSELHRGFLKWAAVNNVTSLYFMPITQSAGVAASSTLTFVNSPTSQVTVRVWINDEFVDTTVASGSTVTQVATAVAASINTQTRWPVTANSSVGVVTVTARQNGPRGNWLQIQALILPSSNMTVTQTAKAYFTSGATADSNTAALAAIVAMNFYYIVSAAEDSTQFGAVASQVTSQAVATTGIRQRCFCGSVDTQSNVNTIAIAINAPRAEIIWQNLSDWTPFEIACSVVAMYAQLESAAVPRHNFSNFPGSNDGAYWKVPAPRARNSLTAAQIQSALNNGVTPISTLASGTSQLQKRITTRSLNGAVNDYRIRDAHRVTECDFFGDDVGAVVALQVNGKDIAADPAQGQPPAGPQVTFPRDIRGSVLRLVDDYVTNFRFKNGAAIKAGTVVQQETNPTNRVSIQVPAQVIDIADQVALQVLQVA